MSANKTVADQHAVIGNTAAADKTFARTTHPGADWFYHPVQLGLFIHWGISTVATNHDISWSMMEHPENRRKGKGISNPRQYWAFAEKFQPQNYEPEKWLQVFGLLK